VVRESGQVVGGIQMLVRPLSRWGKIGYIARGPMLEGGRPDIEKSLVDMITMHARRHRLIYLVFDFPYMSQNLCGLLDKRGYTLHPRGVPPSGLITATLMLDIQPPLENLLSRMRTSVRRNIRKGQKSGLEVMLGGEGDLNRFRELMLAICRRRNTALTPPQPDFFKKVWEFMEGAGFIRLFLVRLGEEVISAAMAFTLGDTVRVWKVGWSGAHPYKCPNHLMWWSIIRWAKENGFKQLDFVWVDEHDANLIAQRELRPEAFRDGTTFFKMGFGGRLLMLPRARSQFFHPALRPFVRCGGMGLIRSRACQFLLSHLWSQVSS
jgi:lipid II:glycine glycyltransferase (peptidoglycan interpeptide bridge formation enzyme)